MAWNAVRDQSMGRPSRNASAVIAHTAFVGVCVRLLMRAHTLYSGTPPSREKAHSILRTNVPHGALRRSFTGLGGYESLEICMMRNDATGG